MTKCAVIADTLIEVQNLQTVESQVKLLVNVHDKLNKSF